MLKHVKITLAVFCAAAALTACKSSMKIKHLPYPEAERTEVVDNYFGTEVADPYRWLEDDRSEQTAAWYVFSALGFYPVAPGTTQYVLGAPLFKKATLHFENGKSLVVNAPENSDKNIYIESMSFNGKNYTKNYLEHFELLKGGVLDIKMGDEPNMNRGVSPEDFPYSFSVNEKQKK